MLTVQFIRENRDNVLELLKIKNFKTPAIIDELILVDNERRSLQSQTNELQAELNKANKEIGVHFKNGEIDLANQLKAQSAANKSGIKELEDTLQEKELKLHELLVQIPNVPHPSVPPGKSEADNKFIRDGGEKPKLNADALPH